VGEGEGVGALDCPPAGDAEAVGEFEGVGHVMVRICDANVSAT